MKNLLRIVELTVMLLMTVTAFSCRASEQESIDGKANGGPGISVTGLVSDHLGVALANAPIQAQNKNTGITARTLSSTAGRFTLSNVPPGIYVVSITMPCCAFKPFLKDDLKIEGAQTIQLDIRLEQDDYFVTTGLADDPGILAAAVRKQIPVMPLRPAPKTFDGKPDLSGVWLVSDDPYPEPAVPLPQAAALAKQLRR